jgi:hypothetical protein
VYHYRKSYSCREKGFFREPKIVLTAKTPFAVSLKKTHVKYTAHDKNGFAESSSRQSGILP